MKTIESYYLMIKRNSNDRRHISDFIDAYYFWDFSIFYFPTDRHIGRLWKQVLTAAQEHTKGSLIAAKAYYVRTKPRVTPVWKTQPAYQLESKSVNISTASPNANIYFCYHGEV